MRFEARELKEHAEPVTPADLAQGGVYFSVQFLDEQMLVPAVEPFVFLGKNLREGDVNLLYFQSFESYSHRLRLESATEADQHLFQITSERGIKHIFEYDRALDVLMACAMKRKNTRRREEST